MSDIYDQYIKDHRVCVGMAYHWIAENIPEVLEGHNFEWQCNFSHDESKYEDAEYKAYDDYFYGNKSYAVVQAFNKAWLHHIHNNPHHWQYWVLFEDDPTGEQPYKALEMTLDYIIEMICDWWSFSFKAGNLYEIFGWYKEHEPKMILNPKTKKKVEDILGKIKEKLDEENGIEHSGIPGMKWGVRNGPPYPLSAEKNAKVRMNAVHEETDRYGRVSEKRLNEHPIEKLEDLKKLDKDAKIGPVRDKINHGDVNDIGRHYNCPNCAAAFEMVERGYDVAARVKKDRSNVGDIESLFEGGKLESPVKDISVPSNSVLKTPNNLSKIPVVRDRQTAELAEARLRYFKDMRAAQDKAGDQVASAIKSQGEGARGIIVVGWNTGRKERTTSFHAFNYKVESGDVVYYDVQSRSQRKQNGFGQYSWQYDVDPRDIYVMRTDNLKPSEKITTAIYSNK